MKFDFSKTSEQRLREMIGSMNPGDECRVAAELELESRRNKIQSKSDFWTKVIAVTALIIALISLIWQTLKGC